VSSPPAFFVVLSRSRGCCVALAFLLVTLFTFCSSPAQSLPLRFSVSSQTRSSRLRLSPRQQRTIGSAKKSSGFFSGAGMRNTIPILLALGSATLGACASCNGGQRTDRRAELTPSRMQMLWMELESRDSESTAARNALL
jgi:hypothetical protein